MGEKSDKNTCENISLFKILLILILGMIVYTLIQGLIVIAAYILVPVFVILGIISTINFFKNET